MKQYDWRKDPADQPVFSRRRDDGEPTRKQLGILVAVSGVVMGLIVAGMLAWAILR